MDQIAPGILDAWRTKNEEGEGYAIGSETDTPADAAAAEGWHILSRGEQGMVLCRKPDGRLALVCNANGPWACDLGNDND